jgi:hypothetical protein
MAHPEAVAPDADDEAVVQEPPATRARVIHTEGWDASLRGALGGSGARGQAAGRTGPGARPSPPIPAPPGGPGGSLTPP